MASDPAAVANFVSDAECFHLLVDAVTDYAIYMLDTNGTVMSWNVGAERMKGYTAAEITGRHYREFFSQEDQESDTPGSILADVLANGRCEIEGWRQRKDGTRFWASAVIHRMHDKAGQHVGFANVTRDITEKRAAQQALLRSERQFRILVQGVIDYAIFMLDRSGVVASWNAGAERIKGYKAEEIIGQHISRFYSAEDRAIGKPAHGLEIATREGRYEAEGWRIRKDGTRFWAAVVLDAIHSPDGTLIGFAKITRDITERRQAQDHLQNSERQFRLLVNSVTDYALYTLDPNGIITNWNVGAERINGYTAAEIIGRHFSCFYTEVDRAAGLPTRALQTAATEGRYETEAWRVRKGGSLFWASVVIDPIWDEQRKLVGFSKVTRDITERRQAQVKMEESQARLAQAQKMEALGQLTGGVAHDFNNLLMVVSGFISTIKRRLADDPKGLNAVEAIELAAKRGATLTRQLLSFSRRQSLNPVVVTLAKVVETARPILNSLLGGGLQLVTTILPDTWPVEVDVSEFELALVNMIVNARDAMPQGGTIALTAENVHLGPGKVMDIAGDFVALTLSDTGHGIPPDILARVFDPFFTTKGPEKGTGLGLSQVHGFVHQSRGTIGIKSDVGKGTRITLYLPRADEAAAPVPADIPDAVAIGRSVLLVEDNPEVAAATKELLIYMNCQVTSTGDAEAALDILAKGRFDLVVSDIVMAGSMNGLDLARRIRSDYPGLPVLLATGYSEVDSQMPAGEFIVLRKPYEVSELNKAFAMLNGPAALPVSNTVVDFRQHNKNI